jgi:hypothetical protein
MTTVAQAFTNFLTEISPTKYHNETLIPVRKKSVLENLQKTFPEDSDILFGKHTLLVLLLKEP